MEFKKLFRAGVWIALLFSLMLSQACAQNDIYIYNRIHPNHPDGVVNKLSISLSTSYGSVTKAEGLPYIDRQTLSTNFTWVATDKLAWQNQLDILKEDTVRYKLSSLLTYYFSNPATTEKTVNPDGVVGSPSLSFGGGYRLFSNSQSKSNSFITLESVFPIAWYLSAKAGFNNYEVLEESDSDEYYGGFSIYLKRYTIENFDNPDCPVGSIAFSLSGGSSKLGKFGQIELLLAPANSFTIKLLAKTENLDPPFDKINTASLGFSFYSGK